MKFSDLTQYLNHFTKKSAFSMSMLTPGSESEAQILTHFDTWNGKLHLIRSLWFTSIAMTETVNRILPAMLIKPFRVVYIFGGSVRFPVEDITPTYLTNGVLSTLRQADFLATEVLHSTNTTSNLSQMPVIIIPVHFDRDPVKNSPSCQRSIVIRTFITNDFMTGIAATPNKNFPAQVSWVWVWNTLVFLKIPILKWKYLKHKLKLRWITLNDKTN